MVMIDTVESNKTDSIVESIKDKKRINMRLHPEKDADIIEYLNGKHVTNVIKKLLREQIWLEKFGGQFVVNPSSNGNQVKQQEFKNAEYPKKKVNTFALGQNFSQETSSKEHSDVSLF